MQYNSENTNAFLVHISAFGGFFFPFGNIITPLILWQTLKDRSKFLDDQGKEAINFNISYTLYAILVSVIFIPLTIGSILNRGFFRWEWSLFDFDISHFYGLITLGSLAGLIYILGFILVIIASLKAREGENYKYPFTIKFIK